MAFPAFLDTCTLFGGYLCDTLLRIAEAGAFRPLWSTDVLEELKRSLIRRGLASDNVARRISAMRKAFPDAETAGYEHLIPRMTCDQKDRHILAAAVRANAQVIVTFNTVDFPEPSVKPYEIGVVTPDDFMLDQLDLYPGQVMAALRRQSQDYKNPDLAERDVLARLAVAGVPRFPDEARRHLE